ncbi:MAG: metal-dependent hydrolase [Candidatus Thermoplasmatota archaeon]|nr:metal-dependent hydrolase [Candidatus Thermoplasmatota archaeon]MBU4071059.1 metal-dependent hydrolase [Candidatus Thermoplasmatota archaeon]MBU4143816.1 metal-dependent hydrolase [Candidatus Thermoplasmatota archaeon]MBU4591601.1 metal-dependent hydrolase [Candidatus Thermoplasmatota archaeon]
MDWITHYLVAFITGRKLRLDREQMMAITLGALVLDIDIFYYLFPGTIIPVHGTLTHTLLGASILCILAAVAMFVWKKRNFAHIIGLGIVTHLCLDMINTLSIFDAGKGLFFPYSGALFSLADYIPYTNLVWALATSTVFTVSLGMLAKYIYNRDYPWRVWLDERPIVEYWRGFSNYYFHVLPRTVMRYGIRLLTAMLSLSIFLQSSIENGILSEDQQSSE